MTVVCIMTKLTILKALTKKGMEPVSQALCEIFRLVGVHEVVGSDNGTEFVNQPVGELVNLSRTSYRTISAYNTRSKGAMERTKRTNELKPMKEHCIDSTNLSLAYNLRIILKLWLYKILRHFA